MFIVGGTRRCAVAAGGRRRESVRARSAGGDNAGGAEADEGALPEDDAGGLAYGTNLLADAQVANRLTLDEYLEMKSPRVDRQAGTVESVSACWTEMDLVHELPAPGGSSYAVFVIDPLNLGEALTLAQLLKLAMQDANGVVIGAFAVPSLREDELLTDASVLPGTDVTLAQAKVRLTNLRFVDLEDPETTWLEECGEATRPQPPNAVQEVTIDGPRTLFGGDVPVPDGIQCVQPDTPLVHVREGWSLTLRFHFVRGIGTMLLHSEGNEPLPSQKTLVERKFLRVPDVVEVSASDDVVLSRHFSSLERAKYKITKLSPEHGRVSDWTGRATMELQTERLTFEVWSDVRCGAAELMKRAIDKAHFWWDGMLRGAENIEGWDEKLAKALRDHEPNLREAARIDTLREAEHLRDYDEAMRGFDDYGDWRALEEGIVQQQSDAYWRDVEANELATLGVEAYRRYRWWWQPPAMPEVGVDGMSPPAGVTTRASGGGGPEALGASRVVRVAQPGEPDDMYEGLWCTVNAAEDITDRDFYAKMTAWLEERNGRRWAARMAKESLEHLGAAGVQGVGSMPPYDPNDDAELQAHFAGHHDPQLIVTFVNCQGLARQLHGAGMLDASEVPYDEEVRALLFDRPLPGDSPGGEEEGRQLVYDEVLFGKDAMAFAGMKRGAEMGGAAGQRMDASLVGDAMAPSGLSRPRARSLSSTPTAAAGDSLFSEAKQKKAAAPKKEKAAAKPPPPEPSGDVRSGTTKVTELKLGSRVENSLRQNGIATLADLCKWTPDELLALSGIGPKSLEKIQEEVARSGWRIGG